VPVELTDSDLDAHSHRHADIDSDRRARGRSGSTCRDQHLHAGPDRLTDDRVEHRR
jgi:hypothetical protein